MKIKSVRCKDFKRFTDLTIDEIPASAKLVCLVGPNGSGKSSLFDVFNYCIQPSKTAGGNVSIEPDYHIKVSGGIEPDMTYYQQSWGGPFKNVSIEFHDSAPFNETSHPQRNDLFYIRSGYRHEANVDVGSFQRMSNILLDQNRPQTLMSPDQRVSDNYSRIVADSVESIFSDRLPDNATKATIRDRLIGRAKASLSNLFPDLELEGVGNPMERGTFYFKKGSSSHWKYKNLSAGEKAAFDLLLDFVIKSEAFKATVYCIDEPELHMHTQLQADLLGELYRNIPDDCQLWIATHSIGMLRKAQELNESNRGTVGFVDFGERDFDTPIVITPSAPNRTFWKKTFRVAMGELAELVAPSRVVFCEGSQSAITGARTGEFDAKCFSRIFGPEFPDTEFVSLGSATEVEKNSILLTAVFRQVVAGVTTDRVIDKDDRSVTEIADLASKGIRVLSRRHLESYLFDDEILQKLCTSVGEDTKIADVAAAKAAALSESIARRNPADDFKSMSSKLCTELKRILGLTQCGNTREAFCIDTLAPLITPETSTYQQLKKDVLD
ncbi:MAG TPA: ATP-binding protein [Chthoniobacterales bacterium]